MASSPTTTPADAQPTPSVIPSYRRNGKLFSCEPCRRGKLRCDHATPVCGRCARRNKHSQCVYHPAPLTKPRASLGDTLNLKSPSPITRPSTTPQQPPPTGAFASPPPSSTPSLYLQQHSSTVQPTAPTTDLSLGQPSTLPTPLSTDDPRTTYSRYSLGQPSTFSPTFQTMPTPISTEDPRTTYASPSESTNMSFRDSKTGFLGPTSYNAVFIENPASLSVMTEPYDAEEDHFAPVPPEKIQQGAELLSMLRDIPIYQKFSRRWFDMCDGIVVMQPAYQIWVEEIWSEFGRLLQEGNPDQLRSLSELVWRNTRRPIKIHGQMTAREWAKSASGRNLRWEVVGTIFCLAGLIAVNLSCWDSIFESIRERFVDRETFGQRMRKASEFCLCFCYESEVLNDVYVSFLYEDLCLVESVKGEMHYIPWQRTGEVIDAIVALGLHQGNPVDAGTPFFLAELRKKIFISAYGRDKQMATFLGRPPRLSYRYCKMELPLDLSDEELFLEGPELNAVLANLDAEGWNTSGNLHRTTWQRVWFQHCRIREDILEIALGSGDDDVMPCVENVRVKMEQLNNSFPAFMRIQPEDILNESVTYLNSGYHFGRAEKSVRQINALFTICIHAGIAQTEFLLQRALINRTRTDTRELIPISRRLLRIVLLTTSKRDFFRDFQGDMTYLMAVHGLSAAGVLAIELLKQEQTRQYQPTLLPRSETIQDLSVFISALAAVGPGEGNFFVCNQGKRALKKVLDQILAPTPVGGPGVGAAGHGGYVGEHNMGERDGSVREGLGDGPFFPTGNDVDFLRWLDDVEWDKPGGWMGPSSQEAQ